MRTDHRILCTVLAAVAATAAGCVTAGYEQADTTADRIRDVRTGMDGFKVQSDATLEALAALLAEPRNGLKEKFEAYSVSVDALGRKESSLKASIESMRVAVQDRFRAWEQETAAIANPDIRGRAEERRAAVKDAYQAADTAVAAFVGNLAPFTADMKDLRLALSNDLTPSGLDAVKDTVSRARNAAGRLTGQARPVSESLDRAVAQFSTGEPAPAPAPAPAAAKPADTARAPEAASAERK